MFVHFVHPWRCTGPRCSDCLSYSRVGSLVFNWVEGVGDVISSLQGTSYSSRLSLEVSLRCRLISSSGRMRVSLHFCLSSYLVNPKRLEICYKGSVFVSPLSAPSPVWRELGFFLRMSRSSAKTGLSLSLSFLYCCFRFFSSFLSWVILLSLPVWPSSVVLGFWLCDAESLSTDTAD